MIRLSIFLLLFLYAGCGPGPAASMKPEYVNYTYDKRVIDKIPVYDSLVGAIIKTFPTFQILLNEDVPYYHYASSSKMPQGADATVAPIFQRLGKNFIYGFDVFKDSTVKIHVRSTISGALQVHINEYLSYYPSGKKIKPREFPTKDTLLNLNWQYWIAFEQQGLF